MPHMISMNADPEHRVVNEIAILDLDRTLLNTAAVTGLILSRLADYGIEPRRINTAIKHVESQSGNSFRLFEYIEREFSSTTLAAIKHSLIEDTELVSVAKPAFIYEGVTTLLASLTLRHIPYVILTFGEPEYQTFKIDLFCKLIEIPKERVPFFISDAPNKAEWVLREWFGKNRLGSISTDIMGESLSFGTAVIFDDKISNLHTSDNRVLGVHINNHPAFTKRTLTIADVANAIHDRKGLGDIARTNK